MPPTKNIYFFPNNNNDQTQFEKINLIDDEDNINEDITNTRTVKEDADQDPNLTSSNHDSL